MPKTDIQPTAILQPKLAIILKLTNGQQLTYAAKQVVYSDNQIIITTLSATLTYPIAQVHALDVRPA